MSGIVSGRAGASGLEYDLTSPRGAGAGSTVMVLLHGRGSHKGDLQALGPVLPEDWVLVTPQAPYPGAEWGYGPGWAWYRYVAEDRVVEETLEASLAMLDDFLGELPEVLGFAPGRIVLGGFSQGGTSSLAYGLTRPGRIAAALNFSGFLPASVDVPDGEVVGGVPPVFWGHGQSDPNIPFALAIRGRDRLKGAGVPLVAMDYPIGHWMVPDEIHDAVAMIGTLP
ncbi:MAG: alpha/beta hydrolase-fold protein [Gemmatimonadota bacterium]|nr:alpha/beta hydrolase-fold protein [Gemmatimonadota bacterium]